MPETLDFSLDFYSAVAVQQVAAAFAGLATFDVQISDGRAAVTISDPDPEVAAQLEDEFCNHVLNESIRLSREPNQES